ncbi:FecCD family ABC transporter permease [Microbacterium sp. TNHR37B]|uniref:FecCD family ABC transporter permease n=1 Tax=Microbacterium sp. TNHR37B TaxID=1775956 RepID=UPI0007B1924B|nr:iron chelate uptake ABC transporter family permease subunit [Microbacterium sp. TNHR37B]KZE91885.1 Ferric enterobactin transport system permease protein FepG [Microbacterium sp. TNHR37B]
MTAVDLTRAPGGARVLRLAGVSIVYRPRTLAVTLALVTAALAAGVIAMGIGSVPLTAAEVVSALGGTGTDASVRVVHGIRLPRVVTAVAAGAALGIAGAVFQSISRNALGSPDVIGFTTGAATGALTFIVVFGASSGQIAFGALVGGIATAAVVLVLARRGGSLRGRQLILVGIGVGAVLSAVNGLLLVKGDLDSAAQANLWLAGSLDARGWEHAVPVTIGVVIALPVVLSLTRSADIVEMGDDLAGQLGVRTERVRLTLVALAVTLASLATAATGPIAFVALAAPQLARRLTRDDHLPAVSGAAMGAALLVVADLVTRVLPVSFSVPIGRMTGVIGGLYLLWLLVPSRRRASL